MEKKRRYQPEGFAERLKSVWLGSGLTQAEVARRIGYERKAVSAWMYGDYVPGILVLSRLCALFHVSADYLLFGKEKRCIYGRQAGNCDVSEMAAESNKGRE